MTPTAAELKLYRSLAQKKFREKERLYLVEGVRLCEELVKSRIEAKEFLCTEQFGTSDQRQQRLLHLIKGSRIRCTRLPSRQFEQISTTEHSQGIVAVAPYHDVPVGGLLGTLSGSPAVLLDRISDPGNLGTIIRTCAWFGTSAVFIGRGGVEPYNPKVVRSTMGGLFTVPFATDADLGAVLPDLRKKGYTVYSTHASDAEPVSRASFAEKSAFIFGNEAEGIDAKLLSPADKRITIPGGKVESLSVGVAVGIVLAFAGGNG